MYYCECGERLECFEGEWYCPECTRWEAIQAHDQATAEALASLAVVQPDHPEPPDGDEPPF